jgi:N-acyl-D-amino-acid deacylase
MIKFWLSSIIVILFAACGPSVTVDTLITGGRVVDGTGAVPYTADVGIRGDRIVFIGDANREGVSAGRTIDAAGLVVAPGFY